MADMPAKYMFVVRMINNRNDPLPGNAKRYAATIKSSVPLLWWFKSMNRVTFGMVNSNASKYIIPLIALNTHVPIIANGTRNNESWLSARMKYFQIPARAAFFVSSAMCAQAANKIIFDSESFLERKIWEITLVTREWE